jgi:hypothetical protein
LGEYLAFRSGGRFQYGIQDCCLFAAGYVKAVTGVELMAGIQYSNRLEALREVRRLGGMEAAVRRVMARVGFPEIKPLYASRGDVVIANIPTPGVGIVGTDGWHAVFLMPKGVGKIPLSMCRLAWRIG